MVFVKFSLILRKFCGNFAARRLSGVAGGVSQQGSFEGQTFFSVRGSFENFRKN